MSLAAKSRLCFALLLAVPFASNADAQGILVQDTVGQQNWIAQTAKQASQYVTQIEQYKTQLQNTVAPAAYLWDQSQTVLRAVNSLNNIPQQFSSYGGFDSYLNQFRDTSYYSSSPCYSLAAVAGCDAQTLFNDRSNASAARTQTNKGLAQVLNQQQQQIQTDATTLTNLQNQVGSADGQMKALQGTNQLLSSVANQVLQLRATTVASEAAAATARQAENDEDARLAASRSQFATVNASPAADIGY